MTRLTNTLRDKIVTNAMAKTTFDAESAALDAEKYALAEQFRIASLGGPDETARLEKLIRRIERDASTIPTSLCTRDTLGRRDYEMFMMNLGGLTVSLHFSDSTDDRRLAPSRAVFPGDHPLVIQFHDIDNRESDFKSRRDAARLQIRAVVNSCTTVKKLLEVWPEAKELLPVAIEESRSQLPAVQVAELNALIGLPSDSVTV